MADAIIELCDFFWGLCSKSNRKSDFQKLHTKIGPILCKLESKFPPAFFVVMIHLTVHLAQDAIFVFNSFHASANCLVYFIVLCTLSFLLTYTIHYITMPNFIYGVFLM